MHVEILVGYSFTLQAYTGTGKVLLHHICDENAESFLRYLDNMI